MNPDTIGYVWTGEYELNTLRVDGEIFESATKKLRIRKYPYTCGQGLSERALSECVFDGVFISTIQTFAVRLVSKSELFFVCYYNSMDEFKLKLFELSGL